MKSVFISYSWENDQHIDWVKKLATKLREDGVDARIDQWELAPGDQLTEFMEKSIRENDYVLVICTPTYKLKSDERKGGVGYEGDIITSELFGKRNNRKFIPILRKGTWNEAAPTWLGSKLYLDLSDFPTSNTGYNDLEATINDKREVAPPIGSLKSRKSEPLNIKDKGLSESGNVKIIGVIADEVTMPKNDGTRGSALYKIPFKLSQSPSSVWKKAFINSWNHPSVFTTMHRPGIASVYGNTVYLDGTTMEEVKKYHRETLILAVNEANKFECEYLLKKQQDEKRKQEKENEHNQKVTAIADELDFG